MPNREEEEGLHAERTRFHAPISPNPHYLCSLVAEIHNVVFKVQIPGCEPAPGRSKGSYLCAHSLIKLMQTENTISPNAVEA